MKISLYKRDQSNIGIREWSIEPCTENTNYFLIRHGILTGSKITEKIPISFVRKKDEDYEMTRSREIASLVQAKRKQGYRSLDDLGIDLDIEYKEASLLELLNIYLPQDNLDINGNSQPMLAKAVKDHKSVNYNKSKYLGGAKINGWRCKTKFIVNPNKSMFSTHDYEPIFISRLGTIWNHEPMRDYLLSIIPQETMKMFHDLGIELDGEFYIPGYTVNVIGSAIKTKSHPLHKYVQYWLFDLAYPELDTIARFNMMDDIFPDIKVKSGSIDEHLTNIDRFVTIERLHVESFEESTYLRDLYIDRGFEGIVMRDIDKTYQYGKRNASMFKYKVEKEGEFLIIDVIPEGDKRMDVAKLVLKNDINDETFEATINTTMEHSRMILQKKTNYIGTMVNVVYRERSGVLNLPFHAKARFRRDEREIRR